MFEGLKPRKGDPLLSLIGEFARDPRPGKIDMGVGVYRDEHGRTPVFRAVKAAEARLLESQDSKSYIAPGDDPRFVDLLRPLVFGEAEAGVIGVHTAGGTGALRLAAALIGAAKPGARIWLGVPSWFAHAPIFAGAGLEVREYPCFDPERQMLLFDETMGALERAGPGDAVLLHGCCHNPTGADFSADQWQQAAALIGRRGLLPVVDLAYQGLGEGVEADAAGLGHILAAAANVVVAYSCDKNFGLYRERVGALFVRAGDRALAEPIRSTLFALAPMAPDHGASVVRIILEDPALVRDWRDELDGMQRRIAGIRARLAVADPFLAPLGAQRGMFSLLPWSLARIEGLRRDHGVYMAASGRINLAGLTPEGLHRFVAALG